MKNKKEFKIQEAHKQLSEKVHSNPGVAQVLKTYEKFVKVDASYKEYMTSTRSVGVACYIDTKTKF